MRRQACLGVAALFAGVFLAAMPAAEAGLAEWQAQVAAGTPAVFTDTNIAAPTTRNIGALAGDKTYEFIVNASDAGASSVLIGAAGSATDQSIKFEQWANSGRYGITQYGVADYRFSSPPITINQPVHLAFVVDAAAGRTTLLVNGVPRSSVNFVVALQGTVGVGQASTGGGDPLTGTIVGIATYDSALSQAEARAHANAYFGTTQVNVAPAPLKDAVAFYLSTHLPAGDSLLDYNLTQAVQHVQSSRRPGFWQDDLRLTASGGQVFQEELEAIRNFLQGVANSPDADAATRDDAQWAIKDLLYAEDTLVLTAIADAIAAGKGPKAQKEIQKATQLYNRAVAEAAAGRYANALKAYRDAWKSAMKALAM